MGTNNIITRIGTRFNEDSRVFMGDFAQKTSLMVSVTGGWPSRGSSLLSLLTTTRTPTSPATGSVVRREELGTSYYAVLGEKEEEIQKT